jgi:erythronate-4-phosphate dehydrogenase
MKIVADKDIPFLRGVLEPFAEVLYLPGREISGNHLKEADALLTRTRTICNEKLLGGSAVRFIGSATIGHDHIDKDYCSRQGIKWTNAPGCNASSVNQYVASALASLSMIHRFKLADMSIGIVGVGNVGSKVVKTAELFGMHVYLCDPPRADKEGQCGFISLDGIIRESDIITFHVPLTSHGQYPTFHMINEGLLSSLKPGTIIINTSRGNVADGESLKRYVGSRKDSLAVLDVWENEPYIDRELLGWVSIATPHIAGYSADGKANATTIIVRELSMHFGLPLNDWKVENIPVPEDTEIFIDCNAMSKEEVLAKAITASYDVMRDDRSLRMAPFNFEKLRSEYPLRREFQAYTLVLDGSDTETERLCRKTGFKVRKK